MYLRNMCICFALLCSMIAGPALAERYNVQMMNCSWTEESDKTAINNEFKHDVQFAVDRTNRLLYDSDYKLIKTRVFNDKNIAFQKRVQTKNSNMLKDYNIDLTNGTMVVKAQSQYIDRNRRARYGTQQIAGKGYCSFVSDNSQAGLSADVINNPNLPAQARYDNQMPKLASTTYSSSSVEPLTVYAAAAPIQNNVPQKTIYRTVVENNEPLTVRRYVPKTDVFEPIPVYSTANTVYSYSSNVEPVTVYAAAAPVETTTKVYTVDQTPRMVPTYSTQSTQVKRYVPDYSAYNYAPLTVYAAAAPIERTTTNVYSVQQPRTVVSSYNTQPAVKRYIPGYTAVDEYEPVKVYAAAAPIERKVYTVEQTPRMVPQETYVRRYSPVATSTTGQTSMQTVDSIERIVPVINRNSYVEATVPINYSVRTERTIPAVRPIQY